MQETDAQHVMKVFHGSLQIQAKNVFFPCRVGGWTIAAMRETLVHPRSGSLPIRRMPHSAQPFANRS